MAFTISRSINGISLNGNEYLLNKVNNLMRFKTEEQAILYMAEQGVTDLNSFNLEEEKV